LRGTAFTSRALTFPSAGVNALFVLALAVAVGCSNSEGNARVDPFENVSELVESKAVPETQFTEEDERAFLQCEQADLVVDYETTDDIRLTLKGSNEPWATVAATDLPAKLEQLDSPRSMVVVVLGKRMHWTSDQELEATANEIELIMKVAGFEKIIIQLATATGRPIYRE